MEAAGLALTVLPLIISVAKNYRKLVSTPFCRYQNFADEAGRYVVHLKNQHACFETKCIYLLAHVTSEELASSIINAPHEHASEVMTQVGERLESILSNSRDTLIQTVTVINAVLTEILKDGERLSSAIKAEDEARKHSGSSRLLKKECYRHFGQKLRFSFSSGELSRNLDDLIRFINEFTAISDLVLQRPPHLAQVLAGKHGNKVAQEHQAIREAATAVNAALVSLSCKSAKTHLAGLCIGKEEVVHSEQSPSIIGFEAAIHCPSSCCEFLHLSVSRSSIDDPYHIGVIKPDKLGSRLRSILRLDENSSETREQTSEPRAAFEARRSISSESIALEEASKRKSDSLPEGDVCEFLSQSIRGFDDGDFFIKASLAHDKGKEAGPPTTRTDECPMRSGLICLSDLLNTPPDTTRLMPIYKRFWLAKTLAVAFFRYRPTHWAESGWESRSVYFHTSDTANIYQSANLHHPWLRCSVRDCTHSITCRIDRQSRLVRDAKDLFALGATLIEVGYSKNWESLGNTYQHIGDDTLKTFFQARRLHGQGLCDMGGIYRNIVEKLIESLFENRYDLDDQRTQELFLVEIVRPLEEEERKLRDVLYGRGSKGAHESHTST